MKTRRARWSVLALGLAAGLGLMVLSLPAGKAEGGGRVSVGAAPGPPQSAATVGGPSLSAAPQESDLGFQSIAGSGVETPHCYQADETQTLCFTVYNGSTDGEWVDRIRLTFPTLEGNWNVVCNSALEDTKDSVGYPIDFSCSTPQVYEILYEDNPGGWYGISLGASWQTCVDVTVPAGYAGIRPIPWVMNGSDGGSESGEVWIEECTPLTLKPSRRVITACNGTPQMLEFQLENYGAGDTDVELTYDAAGAAFGGPTSLHIQPGEVLTFTAQLEPELCLAPGEQIVAELMVNGGGHMDSSAIIQTISENAGWRRRDDSPIASMDNVVVWASHQDGGLWSIGGYGSAGAAQRYDPASGDWITYANPLTPVIEYPMDGCYGLNDQGEEIVVLFPDTLVTDELQVFNITTHEWRTRSIPGFFPVGYKGRWGFDVVSLLNNPVVQPGIANDNVCYLSGGANREGGGRERNLWRYDPATNGGQHLGAFPATVWFGFHASWYVPWIGGDGGICVAGGVDHNHQVADTTQCYDIGAGSFNAPNADLGTLPEPWWGMADGWQINADGDYEIWIANGVAQNGTLLPASAYFREGMSGFAYGPAVPEAMYRLEGDGYESEFFTLNGSRGGFWTSEFSLQLAPCPRCHEIFLPLTLRDG